MLNKLFIIVLITVCLPILSFGGVMTKFEIQKEAYTRICSTLSIYNVANASEQYINELATELCGIYDYLPNESFDEKVGSWLIDSLVNMVTLQVQELLSDQDRSSSKIKQLHDFAEQLFPALDAKQGDKLLMRRDKLLAIEAKYSDEIFQFLVHKFSEAEGYKVILDHDPNTQRLLSYIDEVQKKQSNKDYANIIPCTTLDDFSKNLDSRIMTMVLMRDISVEFASIYERNYMSIFSFYSRAYEESFFQKSGYPSLTLLEHAIA